MHLLCSRNQGENIKLKENINDDYVIYINFNIKTK